MIKIDDEVRDWFLGMCQGFADAKFIVQDSKESKESATIFLPAPLSEAFGWSKQVATIQYMGGSRTKPLYYDTIEIRFYGEGLDKADLKDIVEAQKSRQKQQWNGPHSYYHYNIWDIEDFDRYIKPILQAVEARFQDRFGELYSSIPVIDVPLSLRELPRYGKESGRK